MKAILHIRDISLNAETFSWKWSLETIDFTLSQREGDPCVDKVIILAEDVAAKMGLEIKYRMPPARAVDTAEQKYDAYLLNRDWFNELWDNS